MNLKKNDPVVDKSKNYFPVCEPKMDGREAKYVIEALVDNEISSMGGFVKRFAKEFGKKVNCKYAVPVSSGFMALYIALRALGVRKKDEIICPTFTMIATPNAIRLCGAKPVFVDCDETGNIDVSKIEEKITDKTKGILPVHIYGKVCDMDAINKIAKKHDLFVLEDAAEAHGAKYKGVKAGALGDMAAFSFYANKIITTGEGGMITTNNRELFEIAESIRDYAFTPERHFWHQRFALNGRMGNLQAAVGVAQTEKLGENIEARKQWAEAYQVLEELDKHIEVERYAKDDVCWMAGIRLPKRDKFREALASVGIETRTYFIPCHLQPIYYNKERYIVSERLGQVGLYLPTYNNFTKKVSNDIINNIIKVWENEQ